MRNSVCGILLLLALPTLLITSACDRGGPGPTSGAESPAPIDWSREPNPFAEGGDRTSFRALMREIDHHYLRLKDSVDALGFDPADEDAFRAVADQARAILAVSQRTQFRYQDAPSSGLFAERRAELVGALEEVGTAAERRAAKEVRTARDRLSRACDLCHGSVRQATNIQPLMRYLEGLVGRSQRLLKAFEDPARKEEFVFRRFAEVAGEFRQIAQADALLRYRPDEEYRKLCARFEEAARSLEAAAQTRERTALERAFLEATVGSCVPCHDRFVK